MTKKDTLATIADINNWSQSRGLKLNAEKSEIIMAGDPSTVSKLSQADKTLQLSDGTLTAKSTVRNLGTQLDSGLSFDDQARICVKTCYE